MIKIFSLLFSFLVLSTVSFSQSKKVNKKRTTSSKKINVKQIEINSIDTAAFYDFIRTYGDSLAIALEDTIAAMKIKLNEFDKWEDDSYRPTKNKIRFPHEPLGWVSDFENIFTESERASLDSLISSYEKETSIEIAIVTIDSSIISREKFDSLTLSIGNNWGVGKKEKNNGILIGISRGLRKIRIQNGKGIVPKLSDNKTKLIIDTYFIPKFKNGEYFKGCFDGTLEIMRKIR